MLAFGLRTGSPTGAQPAGPAAGGADAGASSGSPRAQLGQHVRHVEAGLAIALQRLPEEGVERAVKGRPLAGVASQQHAQRVPDRRHRPIPLGRKHHLQPGLVAHVGTQPVVFQRPQKGIE